MSMGDKKKWCSGLVENGAGGYRCKYGHSGPGMQACFGSRYPDGKAPAPCERDDLPFDEIRKCVTIKSNDSRRLKTIAKKRIAKLEAQLAEWESRLTAVMPTP